MNVGRFAEPNVDRDEVVVVVVAAVVGAAAAVDDACLPAAEALFVTAFAVARAMPRRKRNSCKNVGSREKPGCRWSTPPAPICSACESSGRSLKMFMNNGIVCSHMCACVVRVRASACECVRACKNKKKLSESDAVKRA